MNTKHLSATTVFALIVGLHFSEQFEGWLDDPVILAAYLLIVGGVSALIFKFLGQHR